MEELLTSAWLLSALHAGLSCSLLLCTGFQSFKHMPFWGQEAGSALRHCQSEGGREGAGAEEKEKEA